jgi:cation:H+ antiporter
MDFLLVLVGLALLLGGGEVLVRGGVGLAARLGWSPAVIGAVVLGFGTSTPELMTSVQAAWQGSPGIAVGNIVGSNIANILLVLGAAAALAPVAAQRGRTEWALLGATALGVVLLLGERLGRVEGLILLAGLVGYIWVSMRSGDVTDPDLPQDAPPAWRAGLFAVVGIALLMLGAGLLVTGATDIARHFGVPETVIGLTLVAVGTSLLELATSLVAAWRGQGQMALGNVLGSNVFNLLGILGITALVVPIPVPPMLSLFDIAVLALSAFALVLLLKGPGVPRVAGVGFLLLYAAYVGRLAAAAS